MTPLFWTLFILLLMIIFMFLSNVYYIYELNKTKEQWTDYMRKPFNFLSTGSNPLNFYRKDIYRKPFMYPQKFYQSYPLPSMQYLPLL